MMKGTYFTPGSHYVFSVHPCWVYAGTVGRIEGDEYLILKDGIYHENTGGNYSCWDLAKAPNASQQRAVSTSAHPLPKGFALPLDFINGVAPAVTHFRDMCPR